MVKCKARRLRFGVSQFSGNTVPKVVSANTYLEEIQQCWFLIFFLPIIGEIINRAERPREMYS